MTSPDVDICEVYRGRVIFLYVKSFPFPAGHILATIICAICKYNTQYIEPPLTLYAATLSTYTENKRPLPDPTPLQN